MTQAPYDRLSDDHHQAFLDLAVAHSPENLSADGECSPALQTRMLRALQQQWQKMEKDIGFRVTEA